MLRARGIEKETLLTYTADNGPEGQSIHGYHGQKPGNNPGSTNGAGKTLFGVKNGPFTKTGSGQT